MFQHSNYLDHSVQIPVRDGAVLIKTLKRDKYDIVIYSTYKLTADLDPIASLAERHSGNVVS